MVSDLVKSANETVLDAVFEEFQASEYPGLAADDAFERFSVAQVLKPREVTPEEIEAGIVDGSHDGGIDSFYVFVNGTLLDADDPLLAAPKGKANALATKPEVEVFLIQSRNKPKWEESTWEHLLASLPKLLNPSATSEDLEKLFNSQVVERTGILRNLTTALATKFPRVSFRAVYVARAEEKNVTASIQARAVQVQTLLEETLTASASVSVEHVGIKGLYEFAAAQVGAPGTLEFRKLLREDQNSYLGVVELSKYLAFVRDDSGNLREDIFDSNVRDFEGDNSVNLAIRQTLSSVDAAQFWWLNNGITVLGDDVDSPADTLTVDHPLVVNGLQTSHVLHRADLDGAIDSARLSQGVVVRVIVSTDEEVRDAVIAGTNRQTRVATPALFATKPEQLLIEKYFLTQGFYYERRKNRYKNQHKPARYRVSITLLAQAIIALHLGQPDAARARPSTILLDEDGYDRVFASSLGPEPSLRAVQLLRAVEDYLRTDPAKKILDDFTNARFFVLVGYAMLQVSARSHGALKFDKNFKRLKPKVVSSDLDAALRLVASTVKAFGASHPGLSRDSMFKSADFRDAYFKAVGRRVARVGKTISA